MAFAGSFTTSQGSNIAEFTLTDNSTDWDATITNRVIYPYKIDGSLLGGEAVDWPIDAGVGDTITLDILDKDYALSIVVVWEVPSPELGGAYTKTCIVCFVGYSNNFIYGIIQQMAASPSITNDSNYLNSLSNVQTYLDSAILSTENFSDQFNSQSNLDRIYYIQQNQTLYF